MTKYDGGGSCDGVDCGDSKIHEAYMEIFGYIIHLILTLIH